MKLKAIAAHFAVLFLGLALTGCAGLSTKISADVTCTTKDTNAMLKSGEYRKKVDNFLIIQDASSTMGENYGKTFSYNSSKLLISKDLVKCINNNLPNDFDVEAGMRIFGPVHADNGLIYGMTQYSNQGLDNALRSINGTGGITPVANALIYGADDLYDTKGRIAVILFSDGLDNGGSDPVAAAAAMKDMYGNNICIYTVLIGNDPAGRITMEQIADAGTCGFYINGETISDADGMEKFVTEVFFDKVTKAEAPPAPVRPEKMISVTMLIEFDFDKDTVKPKYHDYIANVASELKKYPGADTQLEGHTDSMGSDAYNMSLSKRRAESVKRYLVEKFGISAGRITTVGYGESSPVASNKTDAGRQLNRRVVANIK